MVGGGNYLPEFSAVADVWCSEDGKNWTQVTDKAPWHPRIWASTVVYRNNLWVLGGWSKVPDQNWGDVWYSPDGKEWKQLKSDVVWKERHEHSTYVHNDRIWVAGGRSLRKFWPAPGPAPCGSLPPRPGSFPRPWKPLPDGDGAGRLLGSVRVCCDGGLDDGGMGVACNARSRSCKVCSGGRTVPNR